MDYDFAQLDIDSDSEAAVARRDGWVAAVSRGFHSSRPDEEFRKHWLKHVRTDRVRCTGAWLPEGTFGAGPMPVATFASFDKTINAGHEIVPLRMITDVTTSPAHRRQGLLRRLMEDDLADAVAQRVPLAALTASEATIYGRWGFGAATFSMKVELDTGPRFGLRAFEDPGRVELVEPPESWPVIKDVFDRFHAQRRGSVEWPQFYEPLHTGAYDFEDGPDKKVRGVVHLDADGTVDGVALYRNERADGEEPRVKVSEMMALTPSAGLALWRFLASIDLVKRVTFEPADPADPLRWALTDMNALTCTKLDEFLWVRVLDVERSLTARPWTGDGTVVLGVEDPLGHAAGRYLVEAKEGRATVTRTDEPAEVTVDVETLGSLYLGWAPVMGLRWAGRIDGTDEAVARFAAIADLAEAPYNVTGF